MPLFIPAHHQVSQLFLAYCQLPQLCFACPRGPRFTLLASSCPVRSGPVLGCPVGACLNILCGSISTCLVPWCLARYQFLPDHDSAVSRVSVSACTFSLIPGDLVTFGLFPSYLAAYCLILGCYFVFSLVPSQLVLQASWGSVTLVPQVPQSPPVPLFMRCPPVLARWSQWHFPALVPVPVWQSPWHS